MKSEEIIAWIANERKARGISLRSLEILSGVSYKHINKIEKGELPNPGIKTLEKLVNALGMEINIK